MAQRRQFSVQFEFVHSINWIIASLFRLVHDKRIDHCTMLDTTMNAQRYCNSLARSVAADQQLTQPDVHA